MNLRTDLPSHRVRNICQGAMIVELEDLAAPITFSLDAFNYNQSIYFTMYAAANHAGTEVTIKPRIWHNYSGGTDGAFQWYEAPSSPELIKTEGFSRMPYFMSAAGNGDFFNAEVAVKGIVEGSPQETIYFYISNIPGMACPDGFYRTTGSWNPC